MDVPIPILVVAIGAFITMAGMLWRYKTDDAPGRDRQSFSEWKTQHAEVHRVLDTTLKDQSDCLHRQKVNLNSFESRCNERCRQEEATFVSLQKSIDKLNLIVDDFRDINSRQLETIATLKAQISMLLEKRKERRKGDDDEGL